MVMTSGPDGRPTRYQSTGVWPAVIVGLVLALAIVIFVAQNLHAVRLRFLWFHFRTPPAVLVLATGLLAVATSVALGAAVRAWRRRILRDREELERLRGTSTPATPPRAAPAPSQPAEPTTTDSEPSP
jgi:uncharacterized integral membrane protein